MRLRALARGGLAALAARGLLLGGGAALRGAAARAGLLAATARGAGRVGDLRRALLGHPLVLERLVLLLVLDVGFLVGHALLIARAPEMKPQASSAARLEPDRSAFGMNPRA